MMGNLALLGDVPLRKIILIWYINISWFYFDYKETFDNSPFTRRPAVVLTADLDIVLNFTVRLSRTVH